MIERELRKVKSVSQLVLNRLLHKDKWLTISFIISIAIILLCAFADLDCILNVIGICICFVCEGEPIYYTLAISCISGLFVYFVTAIIPEIRVSRAIYVEITQQLTKLESDFLDFSLELQIGDLCSDNEVIKRAVNTVKFYNRQATKFYSLAFCYESITKLTNKLENLTSNVLTYTPYLSKEELELLVDIRHRRITKQLFYKDGAEFNLLSECELERYFTDLALLNKDVIKLKKMIKDRTYKGITYKL